MDRKVRVDQSHCNYQLAKWLVSEQWDVVFRDPGRVSRGLSGNQALLLGIFERNSWPIPDIVAIRGGILLFVEIDHRQQVAENSFLRYRQQKAQIIAEIQASGVTNERIYSLALGFCKIGKIRNPSQEFESSGLNFLAWFDDPMVPSILERLI